MGPHAVSQDGQEMRDYRSVCVLDHSEHSVSKRVSRGDERWILGETEGQARTLGDYRVTTDCLSDANPDLIYIDKTT